ncbi:MAG: alkaline phosphatase family protein, partial [Acidobacteriota bacterium]
IPFPKLKVVWSLLKKTLGFRYLLDVIPLDASLVRGSHGREADRADEGPLFMTTEPGLLSTSSLEAEEVYGLLLAHLFSA